LRYARPTIPTLLLAIARALLLCAPVAFCVAPAALGQGSEPLLLSADIPAQPLADALVVFSRLTGLHVVYVSDLVRNQRSQAIAAGLRADEALARLLQGTGLKFEFLTRKSVRIRAVPPDQKPAADNGRAAELGLPDVMVTGSRIRVAADHEAAGPLQVVDAQEIRLTGPADASEVISSLPQMIISSGADFGNHSNPANTAGGFSTADLRGLRPQRTVVLVNGRRLGIGDPNTSNPDSAPDLDQIPLEMIERVEVLTGGASATYGSDAIAGVVNFILKDHVEGLQLDGQYGFAQHTQQNAYVRDVETAANITPPTGSAVDGFRRRLSAIAGTGFLDGAGQVTGYFIYQNQDPVLGSDRDYTACSAHSANNLSGVPTQGGLTCLLSQQSNAIVTNAGSGDAYSVVGNQFLPWPAAGSVPPARFNVAPFYTSQREYTRYQAGLLAHAELSRAFRPFVELSFMDDRTDTEIGPSGIFLGNNTLTPDGTYRVNCSNPLLSAQQAAILCTPAQIAADTAQPGSVSADVDIARRNIEGGGRTVSYRHRNYRAVVGAEGGLGDSWTYSAYALQYHTALHQESQRYLSVAAINDALQVTTDPSGHPVCISGGPCVPYNIFTSGAVTPQQLSFLYRPAIDSGSTTEQILEADFTGQLGRYGLVSPWAHDDAVANVGAERRTEGLEFAADAAELSGDLEGYGIAPAAIDHRVSVNEGFIEVRLPLVQDRRMLQELTIDGGYRRSAYSTAGSTNTYKFDLQYAPVASVRFRTSYDRVVRAPNLIELYTPLSYGPSSVIDTDPCAPTDGGATHAAASLEQCLHSGVTAAQYGNGIGPAYGGTSTLSQCAQGCGVVAGGNPALRPETANTWSLGVSLTPAAIPGLSGSVDYFHIRLTGMIGTVPESVTLQQCLVTGDPVLCSQIIRTPNGDLSGATVAGGGYILSNSVNTGAALVSGADVQLNYRLALPDGWGAIAASLTGSWLQHNSATPYRSAPSFDCAGLFGATCLEGSVNPTWRHNLRVTWDTPYKVRLSAQWRFIGRTGFDNNSPQPLLQYQEEGFLDPALTHIPNYSYFDLAAVWTATQHAEVRIGISNLLDKDPPFVPLEVSGRGGGLNTFPIYDTLGREIFMAVRATF